MLQARTLGLGLVLITAAVGIAGCGEDAQQQELRNEYQEQRVPGVYSHVTKKATATRGGDANVIRLRTNRTFLAYAVSPGATPVLHAIGSWTIFKTEDGWYTDLAVVKSAHDVWPQGATRRFWWGLNHLAIDGLEYFSWSENADLAVPGLAGDPATAGG